MSNLVTVEWKGGMAFEATPPSGNSFVMDSIPEHGGRNLGPSPFEALISSIAACSAIDVVSILEKKRQKIEKYTIEVTWTRPEDGVYPRPIVSAVVTHKLSGETLDPEAVQKAVALSDEKYCSVIASLRTPVDITSKAEVV
jgi:putative redox protein